MIQGIEKFKTFFKGYEDQYTLIGGVACYLSMIESGLEFRATKDLDIVLCAEALNKEFIQKFWQFIKEGEYEHQQKSSDDKQFYRFVKPKSNDFPFMLELFSRKPDNLLLEGEENAHLTPIPIEDEVSSLSAILLDNEYYEYIKLGTEIIDDLPILAPEYIIPFKMKAWLDLSKRKEKGEPIDSKNIKKHRNDVLRISQLLSPKNTIPISINIRSDIDSFLEKIKNENIDLKYLGINNQNLNNIIEALNQIYIIKE